MEYRISLLVFIVVTHVPASVSHGEDFRGYDKLGPIAQKAIESPVVVQKQVQEFVWDHWIKRRRALVVFTLFSKEGEPTTTKLVIEPAADGKWQIRGRSDVVHSDRRMRGEPGKKPDRRFTRTFEAFSVRRVSDGLALSDMAGKIVISL